MFHWRHSKPFSVSGLILQFTLLASNAARRMFISYLLRRGKILDGGRRVIKISRSTVVKCLPANTGRVEAATQQLVASRTSIPVPAIYDYWTKGDTTYIAMEYVKGRQLRYWWKRLSDDQKKKIFAQLKQHLNALRSIPPPDPSYIGRIIPGEPIMITSVSEELFGPFEDEKSYMDWRFAKQEKHAEGYEPSLERLRSIRQAFRTDHRIVLTHGDLGPHNILVECDGPGVDDIRITAIIDWEMSGWLPEHWEYYKSDLMARFPDLREMLDVMFLEYKVEYELEKELYDLMPIVF